MTGKARNFHQLVMVSKSNSQDKQIKASEFKKKTVGTYEMLWRWGKALRLNKFFGNLIIWSLI